MRWKRLHEKGVRIKVIGDYEKFPPDIAKAIDEVVEQTKENKNITVVFALNYGGRDEMIRAINKVLENYKSQITRLPTAEPIGDGGQTNHKEISNHKVTEDDFSEALDTKGIPDPDIIVRTGGEKRLSGFLLWQCNYSELMFPSWYFPDFTPARLDEILAEFGKRERRYGA